MKNIFKVFVIIAMVAVVGFSMTSCASLLDSLIPAQAFDKSVAKDKMVTLYYFQNVRLSAVDGVENKVGPLAKTYHGKGVDPRPPSSTSKRLQANPAKVIRIPAGEHTLSLAFNPKKDAQAASTE